MKMKEKPMHREVLRTSNETYPAGCWRIFPVGHRTFDVFCFEQKDKSIKNKEVDMMEFTRTPHRYTQHNIDDRRRKKRVHLCIHANLLGKWLFCASIGLRVCYRSLYNIRRKNGSNEKRSNLLDRSNILFNSVAIFESPQWCIVVCTITTEILKPKYMYMCMCVVCMN